MSPQSAKELALSLPNNLRYLSDLIARKPNEFTSEWAASPNEAFSLYTRTGTINLILSWNNVLEEEGWPFPAYLNLREEVNVTKSWPFTRWNVLRSLVTGKGMLPLPLMVSASSPAPAGREQSVSTLMGFNFWRQSKKIFHFWRCHHLLKGKEPIIDSINTTFRKRLFPACMPTVLGLLDFVLRDYFQTAHLNVSMQTLRNAFEKAGILSEHLKPGFGVWNLEKGVEISRPFSTALEKDLRLPGIFLSSFVKFGSLYYNWYKIVDPDQKTPLNRHAIMHCASNYWSFTNAVKLLTFFDLTLRLERVLKIVIHGPSADSPAET